MCCLLHYNIVYYTRSHVLVFLDFYMYVFSFSRTKLQVIELSNMSDKTVFNCSWTDKRLNPDFADWIQPVKTSPTDAFCTACKVVINLSNMGRSALVSHSKGSKHKKTFLLSICCCSHRSSHFFTD